MTVNMMELEIEDKINKALYEYKVRLGEIKDYRASDQEIHHIYHEMHKLRKLKSWIYDS